MKKEELVYLHLLLVQLKKYFEDNGLGSDFVKYNELGITPFNVHRSKEEHKQAIFVLGNELMSIISRNQVLESNKSAERSREYVKGVF
jgi:hypothetical protein